jgi:hypothetical protein
MKRMFLVVVALFLSASAAFAAATTQKWTAGYNNFSEPLNYKKSKITWSVNPATSKMSVKYTLMGATPNKLYQVGITFFCTTFPTTFGQFPINRAPSGNCTQYTEQGVTKSIALAELGVVTTDINGDGSFTVVVGPIVSGTYDLEFVAIDGAGCFLIGGEGDSCIGDFQSPGPVFGDTTTITIP